jgi:hypothetical protein
MKNVTITLDAETAKWVRAQAAEKNMSVSRWVGEILQENMGHRREYQRAMRRWLSSSPVQMKEPGDTLPTRDEIHDRSRFR